MSEIESAELLSWIKSGKSLALVDVRQPEEFELGAIDDAVLIPLMEVPERLAELRSLAENAEVCVVYCRSGGRSQQAIAWLHEQGFSGLLNLAGGINAYAEVSDCGLQAY